MLELIGKIEQNSEFNLSTNCRFKKGHFTDEALNQTKKMLRNTMLLSLDRQNTLIEQAYMASVLQKTFMPIAVWLNALEAVSREDISVAATQLRLQAIYFMEGK